MARLATAGLLAISVATCKSATDDDTEGLDPIDSDFAAENAAQSILTMALAVRSQLANGSYTNRAVSGNSGTATASGTVSFRSGISCGSSCVRSENNTSLAIAFSGFVENTADNATTELSGSVTFRDTEWSQQSGLNYTSGGRICIDAASLSFRFVAVSGGRQFGWSDTITSLSSCGSLYNQSGTLTTGGGRSFSF